MFLKISQNSQENTGFGVSFLIKLQASSLNFAKFLGTPFFQRTPSVAAFVRSTDIFLETKCPIYSSTHSGQL